MQEDERWMELCGLASKEQDPEKFMEEINRILEAKEQRLQALRKPVPIPPEP
jgi:hypothetical protein